METLITADDAAQLLGLSRKTIYRMATLRQLPSYKLSDGDGGRGSVRFDLQEIRDWLAARKR